MTERLRAVSKFGKLTAAILAVSAAGCSYGPAELPASEQHPSGAPVRSSSDVDQTPQPDVIDEHGDRYIWTRTLPARQARSTTADALKFTKNLDDMTPEERAAALRPVMQLGDNEYTLDHDPIERLAKPGDTAPQMTPGYRPPNVPLTTDVATDSATTPEFIVSTDDRTSYDHSAISWPAMASVHLLGHTCTGTIVGGQTVVTAAHCLDYGMPDGQTVERVLAYASDTSYPKALADNAQTTDEYVVTNCDGLPYAQGPSGIGYGSAATGLFVSISHTHFQDIELQLQVLHNGSLVKTQTLLNRPTTLTAPSYNLSYPIDLSTTPVNSSYLLVVIDHASGNTGTLNSWHMESPAVLPGHRLACAGEFYHRSWPVSSTIRAPLWASTHAWQYDYAALKFTAHAFDTDWGYAGTSTSSGDRDWETMYIFGYPDQRVADYPAQGTSTAAYPRLMYEPGTISDFGLTVLPWPWAAGTEWSSPPSEGSYDTLHHAFRHSLDIYNGDSGAGLIAPSSVALTAIQSTQWDLYALYGTGGTWPHYLNEARRWDTDVTATIAAPY